MVEGGQDPDEDLKVVPDEDRRTLHKLVALPTAGIASLSKERFTLEQNSEGWT